MKIKYKVINTIEVAGGKIYNLDKSIKIRDGKSGAYDIIEYFCKEYLEKQISKSETNKKEKLIVAIDMETFRKSLVGDGYLKEEVIVWRKNNMNEDKIIIKVVEWTDPDEVYGALAIPRTISVLDVQQTIYDIKAKFQDENSDLYNKEWQIEDVMEQLNKIYPDVEWLDNYETWDYIEI